MSKPSLGKILAEIENDEKELVAETVHPDGNGKVFIQCPHCQQQMDVAPFLKRTGLHTGEHTLCERPVVMQVSFKDKQVHIVVHKGEKK